MGQCDVHWGRWRYCWGSPARSSSRAWSSAAFPGTNGRVLFVSNRDGNQEIYSANADGSDPRRLTTNLVADTDPAYSPDGTKIAFTRGGDIWVMNADGTGQAAVTGIEGPDSEPAWSPDGSQIVYVSNQTCHGRRHHRPRAVREERGRVGPRRVTDTPTTGRAVHRPGHRTAPRSPTRATPTGLSRSSRSPRAGPPGLEPAAQRTPSASTTRTRAGPRTAPGSRSSRRHRDERHHQGDLDDGPGRDQPRPAHE